MVRDWRELCKQKHQGRGWTYYAVLDENDNPDQTQRTYKKWSRYVSSMHVPEKTLRRGLDFVFELFTLQEIYDVWMVADSEYGIYRCRVGDFYIIWDEGGLNEKRHIPSELRIEHYGYIVGYVSLSWEEVE